MNPCPNVYETDCKPESGLSFNDNISVYDIVNVSSVLWSIKNAQNKCADHNEHTETQEPSVNKAEGH